MSMSPRQVRVVDPILSTHARGYRQSQLIGTKLFPIAPVAAYGGKIITFGKEAFRLYNTKRAPGSRTKRISFGYEGDPYAIVPSALEAPVPREWMTDATQVPGIDLGARAVNLVLRVMQLAHEHECANLALNAAKYDADHKVKLVGGDRWTSPDSDPSKDIETAKEAVADSIGMEPNRLMLSRKALRGLKYHPKLIERVKHVNITSITIDILKTLWEVDEIVVGQARVATGADDAFGDVWGAGAWMGYVTDNPDPNVEEPSFGYTYQIQGHPLVETPYWDDGAKSWIYGVTDDNTPAMGGMLAGYLIEDAGLPVA